MATELQEQINENLSRVLFEKYSNRGSNRVTVKSADGNTEFSGRAFTFGNDVIVVIPCKDNYDATYQLSWMEARS